jgi:hypothetical protein
MPRGRNVMRIAAEIERAAATRAKILEAAAKWAGSKAVSTGSLPVRKAKEAAEAASFSAVRDQ